MRLWSLIDAFKPTEGGKMEANLGVTLVGAGAHVMPPWTGRGANIAMLDALELRKKTGQVLSVAYESDAERER